MENLKKPLTLKIVSILVLFVLFIGWYSGLFQSLFKLGGAMSGQVATVASSTVSVIVGTQEVKTLFPASRSCTARVISTVEQPIMLSFSANAASALKNPPSATYGIIQGASTTVNYDSGVYGCSEVTAYGANASTTITILELR